MMPRTISSSQLTFKFHIAGFGCATFAQRGSRMQASDGGASIMTARSWPPQIFEQIRHLRRRERLLEPFRHQRAIRRRELFQIGPEKRLLQPSRGAEGDRIGRIARDDAGKRASVIGGGEIREV